MIAISKRYTSSYSYVPLIAAAISWLVCDELKRVDARLFSSLMAWTDGSQAGAAEPHVAALLTVAIVIASSYAGFHAGSRLRINARAIVGLQMLVAFVVLQWLLAQFAGLPGHPIGFAFALGLGIACGVLIRNVKRTQEIHAAKHYELIVQTQEILETRLQLVKQDEIERRLLAADLHDQVLNDLKMLRQKILDFRSNPDPEASKTIDDLLAQATMQVREVMDSLAPSVLEHLGLAAAIEDCLRRGAERGGYKLRFKNEIPNEALAALSTVEQSLLYRLVQETVTNICKHADAKSVRASIAMDDTQMHLTIADDGKGIDLNSIDRNSRGLRYMRVRADLIGATITWSHGDDDKGTVVEIWQELAGRKVDSNSDH